MLTKRQCLVIKKLTGAPEGMTCAQLAAALSVSPSTIRNELRAIEEHFSLCGGGQLIKKPGTGITLQKAEDYREKGFDAYAQIEERDNRRFHILKRVLNADANEIVTETQLSLELFLSRSSVSRELKAVSDWLSNYHLHTQPKKNCGILLVGQEYDRRSALCGLFFTHMNGKNLPEPGHPSDISPDQLALLQSFVPGVDIASVMRFLAALETQYDSIQTHRAYLSLLLHIALSLYRSERGQKISIANQKLSVIRSVEMEPFRHSINEAFVREIGPLLSEAEMEYIAVYVMFSDLLKSMGMDFQRQNMMNSPEFGEFLNAFREMLASILGVDIEKTGHLYDAFRYHLSGLICRMRNGIMENNTLLQEIKTNYPSVFGACWASSILFEKYYGLTVSDNEIAFLTTYLVTVQEQTSARLSACVVCNYGISVAQLLCERLRRRIPELGEIETLSYERYQALCRMGQARWDIVISTIGGIEQGLPVIYVSPILTDQNERDVQEFVRRIVRNARLDKNRRTLPEPAAGSSSLCVPELVLYHPQVGTKPEVIHMACELLRRQGCVTEEFEASVVNRERIVSTELGFGFAIPHGSPGCVLRTSVAVVRLKKPILWAAGESVDTVFLIACAATPEVENQKELEKLKPFYKMLALLLDDTAKQAQFRKVDDPGIICQYINEQIALLG